MRSRRLLGLLCLYAFVMLACATSPTGRRQLIIQSAPEMAAMGVQAFEQMKTELPRSQNAAQSALVQCVADSITNVLTPADMGSVVVQGWETVLFEDATKSPQLACGGPFRVIEHPL